MQKLNRKMSISDEAGLERLEATLDSFLRRECLVVFRFQYGAGCIASNRKVT